MRPRTVFIAFFSLLVTLAIGFAWILSPMTRESEPGIFSLQSEEYGIEVSETLSDEHYIRNAEIFRWLFDIFAPNKKIRDGGYYLDRNMNAWQVFQNVIGPPDLLWVTLSTCLRKEQIGEILAAALGWDPVEQNEWNELYRDSNPEYVEGVYFPDTYLLPVDESVQAIAVRFIDRFNEKFAPLTDVAIQQDLQWTTILKIASLIEREAAGPHDMALISGIIWNRLNRGMRLEIDATMQYTRGKIDGRWWAPIKLSEKRNDSPYNSYLNTGLPPTPICSPGIAAIDAVLAPEETDCLFYLHDAESNIHCSPTYQGHVRNIREYLE
jgi:UPF0755 protein